MTANHPSVPVALAIGSNLGDRLAMLRAAVKAVSAFVLIETASPIYETPAAYVTDQPSFLNAALVGTTTLPAADLLGRVKQVEKELGRGNGVRYGPRLIDIDVLLYGQAIISDAALDVPHPRMAEREFVLRPLADIAALWRHPATGKTIAVMLRELPQNTAQRLDEAL